MKLLMLLSLVGMLHAFSITAPEDQSAKLGQEVTLSCRSTEKIHSCQWDTPYEKNYPLSKGLKTEGGRLEHFGSDGFDCGLKITNLTEKDSGKWTCSVGVVNDDSEIEFQSASSTVTLKTKKDIQINLDEPFNQGSANVSDDWNEEPIKCIVSNADPKPEFNWFVGEDKLTGYEVIDEDDEATWSQTLKYSPVASHANQTLRCVVDHADLDEDDQKEAGVVLKFTDVSEEYLTRLAEERANMSEMFFPPDHEYFVFIAVGVVIALIISIVLVMAAFKIKSKYCHSGSVVLDVESNKSEINEDDDKKEEEGEKDEKQDEVPEDKTDNEKDEESRKMTLRERVASFFTFNNKPASNVTDENATEVADEVAEKIDLSRVEGEDDNEKTEDADEKTENADEKDAKKEKTSKIRTFFNLFKFRNQTKDASEEIDLKDKEVEEVKDKEAEEVKDKEEQEVKDKEVEEVKDNKEVENEEKKEELNDVQIQK